MYLEVENVVKDYGNVRALKGVSLSIDEGEFFALLGPSGCGKTTTMRCIAGFEEISSGIVRINGEDVTNKPVNRRNIGMMFQSYALFPHMSVFDNVAYHLQVKRFYAGGLGAKLSVLTRLLSSKLGKVPKHVSDKVYETLRLVEMEDYADRPVSNLSGGQQQRVALGRALIMEPSVLLMDEPLSNLDKKLRSSMRDTIREIQQRVGITTVFVTHDQEEAMSMADRIAVMSLGEVLQIGTPSEIYSSPNSTEIAQFVGESNVFDVEHTKSKSDFAVEVSELTTFTGWVLRTERQVENHVHKVLIRPETLEIRASAETTANNEPNRLVGRIVKTTYFGPTVQYEIETEALQLKVERQFSSDVRELYSDGDNVSVYAPPSAVIPIG
jgi:iron(III) transport system ATP-binding protein